MSDPDKPLAFDDMPAWVRERFTSMRGKLGPALTLGNFRATSGGWAASIFTLDGHNGGDFLVLAQPGEKPNG